MSKMGFFNLIQAIHQERICLRDITNRVIYRSQKLRDKWKLKVEAFSSSRTGCVTCQDFNVKVGIVTNMRYPMQSGVAGTGLYIKS